MADMTPEERFAFISSAIHGTHEPCGMPHSFGEGCSRQAIIAHIRQAEQAEQAECFSFTKNSIIIEEN